MSTLSRHVLIASLLLMASAGGPLNKAAAFAGIPGNAAPKAIVVQNFYYALPGKVDEVYRWRLHASEVRGRLGLAVGRVLKRTQQSAADLNNAELPDVVWECEYPNVAARDADVARLDGSREFESIEAHMQTLIRQFHRAVFSVAAPN